MNARAVLFDMDGVLVDSENYWIEREREELLPAVVEEDVPVVEITGLNYREIYDYLDEHYTPAVTREEFLELFERVGHEIYTEHVALMRNFDELATELRDRDAHVAIVSSSPQKWIGLVLDRFDLDGTFDAVVSAEDIPEPGKPEPHVYAHAVERLGVDPNEAIAVEDSENGLAAAVAAGVTTIGYRTPVNQHVDLTPADAVAEGPAELRDVLLDHLAA